MRESSTPLPGTLWGIATYFNPAGYENKLENFRTFRLASAKQGLPLIVVEAAMGDRPFELRDSDADRVIRVRASAVLWQKERLLNIALSHLPADCDKVAWMDTDVLFANDRWVTDTSEALTRSAIVQPFTQATQLPRSVRRVPASAETGDDRQTMPGVFAWWLEQGKPTNGRLSGHTGYALAARRTLLDRFGFYDKGIAGSGDAVMIGAFLGIDPHKNGYLHLDHCPLLEHAARWSPPVTEAVDGSVGTVPGTVFHLWHGSRQNRFYVERGALLTDFDPEQDIRIDAQGCWAWATDKPKLRARIHSYFWMRDEDAQETSLLHLRVTALEERMVYERGVAENLRMALSDAESTIAQLQQENADLIASRPGPVLQRLGALIDSFSQFLLPRGSRLRRAVRRLFLRILRLAP